MLQENPAEGINRMQFQQKLGECSLSSWIRNVFIFWQNDNFFKKNKCCIFNTWNIIYMNLKAPCLCLAWVVLSLEVWCGMYVERHGNHAQERTVGTTEQADARTCGKSEACTTLLMHITLVFRNFQPNGLRFKKCHFPCREKKRKKRWGVRGREKKILITYNT